MGLITRKRENAIGVGAKLRFAFMGLFVGAAHTRKDELPVKKGVDNAF